ncbi:MAG: flagellar brake protein [Planctomycetota bacterium]
MRSSILRWLALGLRYMLSAGWNAGRRTAISRRITTGGVDMNEVTMLQGAEPRTILHSVIDKEVPAIMSYQSNGKWHVAKVLLKDLGACRLDVQIMPSRRPHPINIRPDQPVGVSLKYGYGKFIFESRVITLEPSAEGTSGGTIVLAVPDRIEIVQRRSYFRVDVPKSLKVNTLLWRRGRQDQQGPGDDPAAATQAEGPARPSHYWQGRLVDISAGGAQVVLDSTYGEDFKNGQFVGVRFTPMPYETPVMFNAQIRNILPTADGRCICLGLQIVGLEASPEGRQVLQRLCSVVERYYQINQSTVKQQDFQASEVAR